MFEAGTVTVAFSSGLSIQLKLELQQVGPLPTGIAVSSSPPHQLLRLMQFQQLDF